MGRKVGGEEKEVEEGRRRWGWMQWEEWKEDGRGGCNG